MEAGPSGMQNHATVTTRTGTIQKTSTEDKDGEDFKLRIATFKPMERRAAKAFMEYEIEDQYEWPSEIETTEDGLIRKQRNVAKLHAARSRQFRKPEDEQLSKERHQAEAERLRQFRNPDDEELSQQRHQTHAEEQRQYRNPDDEQLSQERHQADAENCRQFRNPDDEELSQQRHHADAERRRQFRNPDDEELSQHRRDAHAAEERARNLPGQLERAEETPEEALERMQQDFEDRTAILNANK